MIDFFVFGAFVRWRLLCGIFSRGGDLRGGGLFRQNIGGGLGGVLDGLGFVGDLRGHGGSGGSGGSGGVVLVHERDPAGDDLRARHREVAAQLPRRRLSDHLEL